VTTHIRTAVEQAAFEWWKAKKPMAWSQVEHVETPCVNCTSERDCTLAKAVAEMVVSEYFA
jgi:hypothetical protein